MVYLLFYLLMVLSVISSSFGIYIIIKSQKILYVRIPLVSSRRNYDIVVDKETNYDCIQIYILLYEILLIVALATVYENDIFAYSPIVYSLAAFSLIGFIFWWFFDKSIRWPWLKLIRQDCVRSKCVDQFYSKNYVLNRILNFIILDDDSIKRMVSVPGDDERTSMPTYSMYIIPIANIGVFIGCIISLIMSFIK